MRYGKTRRQHLINVIMLMLTQHHIKTSKISMCNDVISHGIKQPKFNDGLKLKADKKPMLDFDVNPILIFNQNLRQFNVTLTSSARWVYRQKKKL